MNETDLDRADYIARHGGDAPPASADVKFVRLVAECRRRPCNAPGHDNRWCQACSIRETVLDELEAAWEKGAR